MARTMNFVSLTINTTGVSGAVACGGQLPQRVRFPFGFPTSTATNIVIQVPDGDGDDFKDLYKDNGALYSPSTVADADVALDPQWIGGVGESFRIRTDDGAGSQAEIDSSQALTVTLGPFWNV